MVVNYAREGAKSGETLMKAHNDTDGQIVRHTWVLCRDEKDFGKMSKVHEIVKKGKQMEPVYLDEIVAC